MKLKKYILHAYILNPLLNLYAFVLTDVFYENQTHIGNTLHHPLYFFLWTISSCFGYYYYSKKIWKAYRIQYNPWIHALVNIGLLISICIPYSKNLPGWINDGHVWLAIVCVVGFILEWIWIGLHSSLQYEKEWKQLIGIFGLCTFLIFYFGHVTSFAEITFSILVNAYCLYWAQKKEELVT